MRSRSRLLAVLVCSLGLVSCQSVYYKTMKSLGKEKRDILVKRVMESKKDQQETKEKLQTTLESFQQLTGFQGGDLEKAYKKLNSQYEDAQGQANKLHDRIQSIDQVSNDMFKEWQSEINQMSNAKLKAQSTAMLRDSKQRQASYMTAMRKTEAQLTPVLKSFQDQVLFLKHNLNARAIGSLKGTSAQINTDVTALSKSIDSSMQEADKLISSLNSADSGSN
jgi:predicted nuclease with TOPRIM domain